ncbi:hypothetical protein BAP_1953 [Bacillus sp. CN2]|nr:hypothetical protein BAP_1953 [Bacillus sp. CN2]
MFVQLALICFPHIIDCLFRQILTAILLDSEEDFILFFERRGSFSLKKPRISRVFRLMNDQYRTRRQL